MFVCPVCGRKAVGKVASDQFYCWDCCVEFSVSDKGDVEIFDVEVDGSLTAHGAPLQEVVQ